MIDRRSLLLASMAPPEPINTVWQEFVRTANKWPDQWNAMANEPGTRSVGEQRAWDAAEEAWEKLRNARRKQVRGMQR